jgi:hypothetical protein
MTDIRTLRTEYGTMTGRNAFRAPPAIEAGAS